MTSTEHALPLIIFGVMFFSLFTFFMVQIAETNSANDINTYINGVTLVRPTCEMLSWDIFGCTASNIGYVFGILGVSSTNPIVLMLILTPFIIAIIYLLILLVRG